MVWTGLPSNSVLMTVRCTILKPGVMGRETLLEAGRKENCIAGFLRESVMLVERERLLETTLQEGSLEISTTISLSSLHPSLLLLEHPVAKPTRDSVRKAVEIVYKEHSGKRWRLDL